MSRSISQATLWSLLLASSALIASTVARAGEPAGIDTKQLNPAPAPEVSSPIPSTMQELPGDYLHNVFTRASYNATGRFYEIMNISGQANQIFGWRTFPGSFYDNQITSDGLTVETVYHDALRQQMDGPRMVTRDLLNPFDTSLRENPEYLRLEGPPAGSPVNAPPWQQPPAFPPVP
jgi:hypothetical protein